MALKQVNEQPVPPSQVNPNVDATLEGIILKCMRKNPAERFQTADELRRVLNDYLAGRIVNLGEATSLITATPTSQLNRTPGGRTQAMPRAAVSPTTTGRIPTTGASHASSMQVPEKKPMSKGKIAAIVIGVIAAIALVAGGAMALMGGNSATKAMPNLEGMTKDEATAKLAEYGDGFFVVSTSEQYDDNIEEGKLISQDPARNTQCEKGTQVSLVFSKGKKPAATVTVPNLKGMTPSGAESALAELNLKGAVGDSVESNDVENGKVASQDQAAGSDAKEGDTITYHLSSGVGKADAGDHSGESLSSAKSELNSLGFTNINVTHAYSNSVSKGYVISQSPTGSQSKDTSITLRVSDGPDPAQSSSNNSGNGNSGNPGNSSNSGNPGSSSSSDTEGSETGSEGSNSSN